MKLRPVRALPSRQARALDPQALPHSGATSAGGRSRSLFPRNVPALSRFDERARPALPRPAQMPFFAAAEEGFVSEVGMRMRSCYYSVGEEVGRRSRAARARERRATGPPRMCAPQRRYARARRPSLRGMRLAGCAGRARGGEWADEMFFILSGRSRSSSRSGPTRAARTAIAAAAAAARAAARTAAGGGGDLRRRRGRRRGRAEREARRAARRPPGARPLLTPTTPIDSSYFTPTHSYFTPTNTTNTNPLPRSSTASSSASARVCSRRASGARRRAARSSSPRRAPAPLPPLLSLPARARARASRGERSERARSLSARARARGVVAVVARARARASARAAPPRLPRGRDALPEHHEPGIDPRRRRRRRAARRAARRVARAPVSRRV